MLKEFAIAALAVVGLDAVGVEGPTQPPPACDAPAHMLIMGGTENFAALRDDAKTRMRQYAAEVPKLIEAFGGQFKVRGRAGAVIEGDWPAWKNIVVSQWPCAKAAQNFWRSDKYEKDLHPLRKGSAVYDIALFERPPQHPKQTGVWIAEGGPEPKNLKCDVPVYLLVTADANDGAKLSAYRKALTESGLMYAYGAVDVLQGTPLEVLEGTWPATFSAKVTRWPCREAFDAFYASAGYNTKYKPLRKDAAVFTAIVATEYAPSK